MALLRHELILPYVTNNPRDVAVNVFWTEGVGDRLVQALAFSGQLAEALTNTSYGGNPGTQYGNLLSPIINRSAVRIDTYDMADAEPRTPIVSAPVEGLDDAASNTVGLPLELAVCLSFHADYASGVSRRRQRGRVYMGPFNSAVVEVDQDGQIPSDGLIAIMRGIGSYLLLGTGYDWVVYSRVADATYPVIGGWIDREWDIQRRRGGVLTGAYPRDLWPEA